MSVSQDSFCMHCGASFAVAKDKKRIDRYGMDKIIPGTSTSVRLGIEENFSLMAPVTPVSKTKKLNTGPSFKDRCLCNSCYNSLAKIVRGQIRYQEARDEFMSRSNETAYVSQKLSSTLVNPEIQNPVETGSPVEQNYSVVQQKRKLDMRSPIKTPRKVKKPTPEAPTTSTNPAGRRGFKSKISKHILNGNYKTALNLMVKSSGRARKDFIDVACNVVQKEVKSYPKVADIPMRPITTENITKFDWTKALQEVRQSLPLTWNMLLNLLARKGRQQKQFETEGDFGKHVPVIGNILLTAFYARYPRTFKFLQSMTSIQLFRHGNSHALEAMFNHLGLCLGVKGTRGVVDRVRKEVKKKALSWRDSVARGVHQSELLSSDADEVSSDEDIPSSPAPSTDSAGTLSYCDSEVSLEDDDFDPTPRRVLFGAPPKEDDEGDPAADKRHPGYCVVWDNVGKMVTRSSQSTQRSNVFAQFANTLLVANRIRCDEEANTALKDASAVHTMKFVPCEDDWGQVKNRMYILVQRMLVTHFPNLANLRDDVCWHINHQYSKESSKKSDVINIGVIKANPASAKGVVQIMKSLADYIPLPNGPDGEPHVCPCHGDQLSCERMVDARFAMGDHELPHHTLKGLEPVPGEFHHRTLMLQDTMNELFKGMSAAERTTLSNIKNKYGHRSVKKDVMTCVQHVYNFFGFAGDSFVCLLAMKLLGVDDPDLVCDDGGEHFLENLARDIVTDLWPDIDTKSIQRAAHEDGDAESNQDDVDDDDDDDRNEEGSAIFCTCRVTQNDIDTDRSQRLMIECSALQHCGRGRWFHASCMGIKDEDVPDFDWWCCRECQSYTIYCCHKNISKPQWVQCSSQTKCKKGQWFHLGCTNLTKIPDKVWFCSADCENSYRMHHVSGHITPNVEKDHIREYSRAVAWQCLLHKVRLDAERENDGLTLNILWKIDLIQFWKENHFKYMILSHRLTSAMEGCVSPRVAAEITHNRTANTSGGPGHNIALDLKCEHANHDFQGALRSSYGHVEETHAQRISQITGSLGKEIESLYVSKIACTHLSAGRGHEGKYTADVLRFVREFQRDNIFNTIPGREHRSFPRYVHTLGIKNPHLLRKRLRKYSNVLKAEQYVLDVPRD